MRLNASEVRRAALACGALAVAVLAALVLKRHEVLSEMPVNDAPVASRIALCSTWT